MRFPDFVPARRPESTDFTRAAALQAQVDQIAEEQARSRRQERAANVQAVGGGVMDFAKMDLGEGKTPLSVALRMAKDNFGGGGPAPDQGMGGDKLVGKPGSPSSTLGPVQSKATLQSPSHFASPAGQGIDVKGAMRNPAGGNWQTPGTRPPAGSPPPPTQALSQPPPANVPGDAVRSAPKGMWKPPAGGSTPPVSNALGLGNPQAATSVPVDKLIDMQMAGAGTSAAPNLTAQVGGKVAANAGSEAVGKGLGSAMAGAGAAVPVVGGVTGALPAALRGDTYGAVKGGVGGAASSTLMAAAPAMAAAGPVGWAGMAGLAALSLYGMFG